MGWGPLKKPLEETVALDPVRTVAQWPSSLALAIARTVGAHG